MADKLIKICDVCGIVRGENNHWWKVWVDEESFGCCSNETDIPMSGKPTELMDSCGQAHAIELFNRFLTRKTLKEQNRESPEIIEEIEEL